VSAEDIRALTTLQNGCTLPSDQSYVRMSPRVYRWLKRSIMNGHNIYSRLAESPDPVWPANKRKDAPKRAHRVREREQRT